MRIMGEYNRKSMLGVGGTTLANRFFLHPRRLNHHQTVRDSDAGFSIKGAGNAEHDSGFSILGASRERTQNPLVKELFPLKSGGGEGGKDLFDGRIKGRGAQRRRAEDLF
jgi:hypothetical protein